MKYQIIYITSLILLLPVFGFAQDDGGQLNQNKREEVRLQMQERTQEFEDEIKKQRDQVRSALDSQENIQQKRLQPLAQERVRNLVELIFERKEATIIRQEKIVSRIESRLEVLTEEQGAPENVQDEFDQTKQKLQESTILIIATKKELLERVGSQISIEDIRKGVELSRASIVETHLSLLRIIEILKISEE